MSRVKKYESMGTHWRVEIWDDIDNIEFEDLLGEIIKMSNDFDNKYSRFKSDSFITKLSKQIGTFEVEEDFINLLKIYSKINLLTNGKINPCIGNTISDFGYDENYTLLKKDIIRLVPNFKKSIEILNDNQIKINNFVLLDFGAIGKGYFVDKISEFLKRKNIKKFLVDGSGDIYFYNTLDNMKYKAGLENPFNDEEVLGVCEIYNQSLCVSATNKRKWGNEIENLNHYIDPDKLKSVEEIYATFIIAENTTIADTLTSALFFISPEILSKEYNFDYLIVNKNRRMSYSPIFENSIFKS